MTAKDGSIQYLDAKWAAKIDDLEQRLTAIVVAQGQLLIEATEQRCAAERQRDEANTIALKWERDAKMGLLVSERQAATIGKQLTEIAEMRAVVDVQAGEIARQHVEIGRLQLELTAARAQIEEMKVEYVPGHVPARGQS